MKTTYQLLLLDVDGTTVASRANALPSQRVIDAVRKAQKQVHVALATGRPIHLTKLVTDALGLHGPSVFNGGAEIIDLTNNKLIHQELVPVDSLKELVKLALPFGYKIYTDDDKYGTQIASADNIKNAAAKFFVEAVDIQSLPAILEELNAVAGTAAHPTTSWDKGDVVDIHVTHEHATKRYGVERLIAYLGIPKESVIAIGDGHNDIPLLEAAGTKIAMGNAPDEVKALADFVTPSIQDDGVAVAIERYILN